MKKILTLAAASAFLLAVMPAQGNMVINGGFETGAGAPHGGGLDWNGTVSAVVYTTVAANVHSGSQAAQLGPSNNGIQQTIPGLVAGAYNLDFWAKTSAANVGNQLQVYLDGTLVDILGIFSPGLTTSYTHYTYLGVVVSGPGALELSWVDAGTRSAFIDDVNLVPVPEPTTMIAGALLLVPFGASTIRFLRKNRKS